MAKEKRRLAAIVFTDMVGYSYLSQKNEALAMNLLDTQSSLVRNALRRHGGREVKTIGDGFLLEFPSALEAIRFALEAQQELRDYNRTVGPERRLSLRIGVHVGDVIARDGDLFGDAVNIASRIVGVAEGGGVCVSRDVYDQVHNKVSMPMERLPEQQLKNIEAETDLYRVVLPGGVTTAPASAPTGRIAIIPFTNISPDPNDGYFADGLTEELISVLSEVKGLRVIARTSVDHYKSAATGAKQIGRELRVSHLLEGSVRKAANRIRIAAHLVDTESEEEVWSERYEKDLDDVFSIQSDIAASVTESLKVKLLASEKDRLESKETENISAYIAYLKGMSLLREGTEKSVHLARKQFELAIKRDKGYAKAYAGMADTLMLLGDYLFSPIPVALREANEFVRKALALDPNLAEARVSLANLMLYDYRFSEAEKEFRKAIKTNPSYATGHHWYSVCLQCFGRSDDSLSEVLLAEELDPLSPSIALSVVYRFSTMGMFEEAEKRIRKLQEIDRKSPLVDEALMAYNFTRRDWAATMLSLKRMIKRDPNDPYLDMDLAYVYAVTGRRRDALKIVERLKRLPDDLRIKGQILAFVYLGLGDLDAAFEWIRYGFSRKELFFSWLRRHPVFEPVRRDARYRELLMEAGLPP